MHILWAIIVGGVAGWLAGRIMNSTGNSVFMNVVLGLVGGVVGDLAFGLLGLSAHGLIGRLICATAGAVLVIVLARAIRK